MSAIYPQVVQDMRKEREIKYINLAKDPPLVNLGEEL